MAYEKWDNSGLLADNERKDKESHPDMTGSVTINGTEMWISGWWKDGRRGRFLSLAFKPKEDTYRSKPSGALPKYNPPPTRTLAEDLDDELPPF